MFSIVGAIIFTVIAVMCVLLILGFPLGEFTMGGQPKVLSKNMRIVAAFSVIVQIFGIIIILQSGGHINMCFSHKVTKYICLFYAVYLSLNTVMNACSKSKKEKYVMTPMSLVAAICFWVTALGL